MLILSGAHVAELLDYPSAVQAVEEAYLARHRGRALTPQRQVLALRRGRVLVMSGALDDSEVVATKVVSAFEGNPERGLPSILASVLLVDPETGRPLALLDGTSLTAIRTAAANGVGVRHLAREDAAVAGLLGSAAEAVSHLAMFCALRPIRRALVYSRDPGRREAFARQAAARHGIPVEAVGSAEEVVRAADVIATVTGSPEPLVRREWVRDGAHLAVAGSPGPTQQEVDAATVRAARVVVDHHDALETAGIFLKAGLGAGDVHATIGEVIEGTRPGRTNTRQITLFNVMGLGILDAAPALLVYRRALERGLGTSVDLQ